MGVAGGRTEYDVLKDTGSNLPVPGGMGFTSNPDPQSELTTDYSSKIDATERLTSDFSVNSDWGRANLVMSNA